jgi:hypothetical protein
LNGHANRSRHQFAQDFQAPPSFGDRASNWQLSRHFERDPIPYVLETDWLAGHIGFEPANPSASYLIGIPWNFA